MVKRAHITAIKPPGSTPDTSTASKSTLSPRELTKQEFGRRLQALMLERQWSQSELARRTKTVKRDSISNYIRGISFPTQESLDALAAVFGIQAQEMLPNSMINTLENDAVPMLEIKQAFGHQDMVWVRISRMMSFDQAAMIVNVLNNKSIP